LTEPSSPEERAPSPEPPPADDPSSAARAPSLTTFTIEGRRAPALFVVGWLGTLVGVGLAIVGLLGVGGLAGTILWVAALLASSVGLVLLGGSETIERRAARAPYAGPSPTIVFLAIIAISQLAGYAVGLPLSAIAEAIPRPVGDLIAVVVQAAVFIGVVRLTVVGAGALSWREMGWSWGAADAARAVLGGAVFAGPVILVTSVVAYVAVQLAGVTPPSPLPPTGTTTGLLLHLLAGAVIAPVAEEVLYRGFALTAWRRTAGTRSAIFRSSILFVLAHVLFVGGDTFGDAVSLAFVGGVVRVPIAFVLGWLFVRTGSLWGPIGLHAAFNGILIALGEMAPPA
jgi:membrane protease YdiL (CAAX protease family)